MTLLTASDDFLYRTLGAIPGLLPKLRYVGGLKARDGGYEHWGLAHVFGDSAAQSAIEQLHRELTLRVLRTPLNELLADVLRAASQERIGAESYVQQLTEDGALLPSDLGGGSLRHFNAVLHSLAALVQSRTAASRRVS